MGRVCMYLNTRFSLRDEDRYVCMYALSGRGGRLRACCTSHKKNGWRDLYFLL